MSTSAARPRLPRRVLWLSTAMPLGKKTGGEIATMNFLDALAGMGVSVDCLAYRRAGEAGSLPKDFASPCDLVIESAEAPRQSAEWLVRAAVVGRPFSVQKYVTSAMREAVKERLASGGYDLVVFDHAQTGWLLNVVPKHLPAVFVAHNVEHRLYEGRAAELRREGGIAARAKAAVYTRESRLMRQLERRLAERCRRVLTLSEADATFFRGLFGDTTGTAMRVASLPIPGQTFASAAQTGGEKAARGVGAVDVGLLGSWVWDVNRDGLEWFLRKVVPRLPDDLSIVVAGKSDRAPGTREQNVRFAGFVPDAAEFLCSARVVVIPSTIGSGIQIKTIETIGLGVPLVATKIALRGIDDAPAYVVEASTPEAMAAAIEAALHRPGAVDKAGHAWWQARKDRFDRELGDALSGVSESFPAT